MTKMKICFAILFAFITLSAFSQAYEIKVKLKDFPNQQIILGHHFASSINPDDTITLNDKGEGVFKGKEKLPGGMYLIFLPTRSYFDFFLDKDQVFSLENDTLDMVNDFKSTGSLENGVFYNYQQFIKKKNIIAQDLIEKKKTANDAEKKKINAQMSEINKEVTAKQNEIITKYPNLFFSTFLHATREVEVPKRFLDENGQVIKELIPDYLYFFRMHFWDNLDFGDARLLRTPIYESKFKLYLEKVVPQMPDTMNEVVDYLMDRVIPNNAEIRKDYVKPEMEKKRTYDNPKSNNELLRYVLITIHNHLASSQVMGMEESLVYEAYYYYTKYAVWSNDTYIQKLKDDAAKKTPLFIGRTAKDLSMFSLPKSADAINNLLKDLDKTHEQGKVFSDKYKEDLKNAKGKESFKTDSVRISQDEVDKLVPLMESFHAKMNGKKSLYDVKSKYTLIWFWEESCSHCRKATPQLIHAYNRIKDLGLQVYAVSIHNMTYDWDKTIKETRKWLEFVNENKLNEWTNVYDPYHATKFRTLYDINSSPVPYLLDNQKRIIAKRIGVDQIVSVIIDEELEEIYDANEGNVRMDKFKEFASNTKFGLRELKFTKNTLARVLDEKDKEILGKFIDKKIKAKENELDKLLKSKLSKTGEARQKSLEDFADSFYNKDDIDFIIERLNEYLTDSKDDKKIMTYFENREKYHLE